MLMRNTDGQRITYREIVIGELIQRDGEICNICKKGIAHWKDIETDHVIPLRMGGKNAISNMQLAHRICHHAKDAALRREFPTGPQGKRIISTRRLSPWMREAMLKRKNEVIKRMDEGENISYISREMGISRPTIYDLLARTELT